MIRYGAGRLHIKNRSHVKRPNKNIKGSVTLIAIILLIIETVAGGAFSYWDRDTEPDIPIEAAAYGSTVTEDFSPGDGGDWLPGDEADKDVYAVNNGDQELIVRARLDETWTYRGDAAPFRDSADAENGYDVYNASQANAEDGLTADDGSVVTKIFSGSVNWIDGADGWWYYRTNLAGGETSDKWLDSVKLLDDADMGRMQTRYYVTADDGDEPAEYKWYEYEQAAGMPDHIDADGRPCASDAEGAREVRHNRAEKSYENTGMIGYSKADYVCRITIQTVLPTKAALDAVFGGGTAFTAPAGTSWKLR